MPTNQSSPWGGPKLRTCSNAKSPTTATSVSTHAKASVATKVPFGQTSLELSGKKVQVKPLYNVASSAPPTRHSTVALSVVSIKENGDGSKTPSLPQQLNGIQNQALGTGLKQLGSSLAETCAPSSIPKRECQNGHNVQHMQKCMSLQTSQPGNGTTTRGHQVAAGDSLQPPSPVHQDLSIKGQHTLQQTNKLMPEAADCSCLPLVPPLRLTLCEYQRPALGHDASSTDGAKAELKSTSTETAMWSHSAKATKCSEMQNPCTTTSTTLNNESVIRDGSSAAATTNGKPQTIAPLDLKRQTPESQCPLESPLSPCRRIGPPAASSLTNGPSVLSANVSATPHGAITAVASSPAGALMGSVTNQISAIQLTRPGKTDDCDTSLSGQDWVMQVDGVEEELPDELENACSDEDDSDCSSINGSSSTASIAALCGVEPMPLGSEDDREERPALVPSLFPFIPPTLYFSTLSPDLDLSLSQAFTPSWL